MTARKRPTSSKIAPGLVALGASAILTVYAAGYIRTRSAAEAFETSSGRRRPAGQADAGQVARVDAAVPPVIASPAAPVQPRVEAVPAPAAAPREAVDAAPATPRAPVISSAPSTPAPPARAVEPRDAPAPVETPAAAAGPPAPAPVVAETAPVAVPAPEPAPAVVGAPAPYTDGIYTGWGRSRHGDIEAKVVVEAGRITSAEIKTCWTRYPCTVIEKLPPQVTARQSYNVDYVSGATESADAFYDAVKEALSKAK